MHLDQNHSWGKYENTVGNMMFYTDGKVTSNCDSARQTKIIFSCGAELKVTGLTEPSPCNYELTAEISCVCQTGEIDHF